MTLAGLADDTQDARDVPPTASTAYEYVGMLRELLEYDGGRLSGWEMDFIESLGDPDWLEDHMFSIKQRDKLTQIWKKCFG